MTELSRAQQDKARQHLVELEAAVDDLDEAGMDVRLMRATIATVKAELGEDDRAERIEAWLRVQLERTVISYEVRFSGGTIYTFAAVKIGTMWFTTASTKRQHGSRALAHWLAHDVTLIDLVRMVPQGECPHVSAGFNRNGLSQRPGVAMVRR